MIENFGIKTMSFVKYTDDHTVPNASLRIITWDKSEWKGLFYSEVPFTENDDIDEIILYSESKINVDTVVMWGVKVEECNHPEYILSATGYTEYDAVTV